MKNYIIFIFAGLLFSGAYSQSPAWKTFDTRSAGLSVNIHWMQLNDAHFSPLRYDGPGGELKIQSVRYYGDVRRHFAIGAKADYLQNRQGFNSFFIQPEFRGGLGFKINDLSTGNAVTYLGGEINATSRMYRFVNEEPDHLYWATSYTAEFSYIMDVDIGIERKAFLELRLPLAGMVSRPMEENYYSYQLPGFNEYIKRLHENFHFATWNRMQAVNLQMLMDISRTRRNSVTLGYELDFARFLNPTQAMYFTNSLFVRIFFDVFVW